MSGGAGPPGFSDDTPTEAGESGSRGFSLPGCPSREELELFAAGSSATTTATVSNHLPRCPVCREVVRRIGEENHFLEAYVAANQDAFKTQAGGSLDGETAAIGDVVPGFRIEGEIHRGAQGVVYRAEQLSTRRAVALKTMLQGKFATTRQRLRFEREVEVVASLRHPNIVTLYESGRTRDGLAFFAMELVPGRPMNDLLKDPERPPLELLLRTFLAIVRAIAYAHQRGVIHRDLKPGNILIDHEYEPHVLDFGLARTAQGDQQDAIETTAAGEFLGTFAYAAPEQLKGDPDLIDVRTDLFALGVILYEILAGERPWQLQGRVSIADLLLARLEDRPVPPSTKRPGIDEDLDIIVLTCLKSSAEERYQTATALADDLENFLNGKPIQARRDSTWYVARKWVKRHRVATATAVSFVTVLIVAVVVSSIQKLKADASALRAARTLSRFRETLHLANPETGIGTQDMKLLEFMDLVEQQVMKRPEDDLLLNANLLNTVEGIHLDFRDKRTGEQLEHALDLSRRLAAQQNAKDAPEVAEALHNKGRSANLRRDFVAAEPLYREALAMHERINGVDAAANGLTMRHLASTLRDRAVSDADPKVREPRLAEAEELCNRALAAYRSRESSLSESEIAARETDIASTINLLATLSEVRGDYPGALARFEEAQRMIVKLAPEPDDFRIGRVLHSIARIKRRLGRNDEALGDLRRAVEIMHPKMGAAANAVIDARCDLVDMLLAVGRDESAATREAAQCGDARIPAGELEANRCMLEGMHQLRHGEKAKALRAFDAFEAVSSGASESKAKDIRRAIADRLSQAGMESDARRFTPKPTDGDGRGHPGTTLPQPEAPAPPAPGP